MYSALEESMSTTLPASHSYRTPRRSTRLNRTVPLTVVGLDCYQAPYREQVSTVSLNCHGCRYSSKHEVLATSWVILELNDEKNHSQPVSVRGKVKWVKRPVDSGEEFFQTGIEFDDPHNVWGIDSPPTDWLPFCGPRKTESDASKAKPFALPKPESPAPAAKEEKNLKPTPSRESKSVVPLSSGEPRVGQLMGDLQRQMEKTLFDAAAVVVQERASSAFEEIRHDLRKEANHVLAEAAALQSKPWIEQSLRQLKDGGQECVRALHAHWTKKIESDLQQALARIDVRQRELEELSSSLAAHTLERVQEVLDTSRKDAVDRIVSRLKEQMAPQVEQAKKAASELAQLREQTEKLQADSMEKFSTRIEEACTGFEKQFDLILRERLDTAREEFLKVSNQTTSVALNSLRESSKHQEAEAQARLQKALQDIAESSVASFKEKIAETSRQFAGELAGHSRSHLEYVGGAISQLAKGLGKFSKD
jgi:BMFP domain-containing protein YqiC